MSIIPTIFQIFLTQIREEKILYQGNHSIFLDVQTSSPEPSLQGGGELICKVQPVLWIYSTIEEEEENFPHCRPNTLPKHEILVHYVLPGLEEVAKVWKQTSIFKF